MPFLQRTDYCGVCGQPLTPRQDWTYRRVDGVVRKTHRACYPKKGDREQAQPEG